jgi:hypothetical protein
MRIFDFALPPGFDSDERVRTFGVLLLIVPIVLLLLKAFVPPLSPPVIVLFIWVVAFVVAAIALFRADPDGSLDHDSKWMLVGGGIGVVFGGMVWGLRRLWVAKMGTPAADDGGSVAKRFRWAKILLD